jgi:hypothetical protein
MCAIGTIEVSKVELARNPPFVGVFRYHDGRYEFLPNVRVLSVQTKAGADPGFARFRYDFSQSTDLSFPHSFEEILNSEIVSHWVIQNDERIVVSILNADGSHQYLFDGFAQLPECTINDAGEDVGFTAYGLELRAWDRPIGGALQQNIYPSASVAYVKTGALTRFNPCGQPNASIPGTEASDLFGNLYPIFVDPTIIRTPEIRTPWTLSKTVKYICYHENAKQEYVRNPSGSEIDALFVSRSPKAALTLNQADSASYTDAPIEVCDYVATGKAWPSVLEELLLPQGFWFAFRLESDDAGQPITVLDLFRKQDGSPSITKELFFQARGENLDPTISNFNQAQLTRATSRITNAYVVESSLTRYEASFVLAPGYIPDPADSSDTLHLLKFELNDPSITSNYDKYRLYVFDETGEGHWDWTTSILSQAVPSLGKLFDEGGSKSKPYVSRRRVPISPLFTKDGKNKPLHAMLSISKDYQGSQPGLWDGTGTWQTVEGGFSLLQDRLGIWINVQNPNSWFIGGSSSAGAAYPAGIVRGIEDQTQPSRSRFTLRLTCVIEGDHPIAAKAARRPSSPTNFEILRRIDARDRYCKQLIAPRSEYNSTGEFIVSRDDTAEAQAEANSRRLANESGVVSGRITLPRLTTAYRIGDRISSIQGRNLSLRTNAGSPLEESSVFPAVTSITWNFDGRQETILELSDER